MDTIDIRRARPADAAQILDLQRSAYQIVAAQYDASDLPPLTETVDDLLGVFPSHTVLVACRADTIGGDAIVGTVRARVVEGTAHIGRLSVRPSLQGRGIGRQLLDAIERAVGHVARFELFTGHRSARSLRMYERAGYHRLRTARESDRVSLVYLEKMVADPAAPEITTG